VEQRHCDSANSVVTLRPFSVHFEELEVEMPQSRIQMSLHEVQLSESVDTMFARP